MKSNRTRNLIIGGAAVLAVVAGGGAYAIADGGKEEKEKPLTTAETAKAEKAATAEVNGRVLYVEYEEDHGGGYEVEIQKKDGSEVEVYLDKSFEVAGVESEKDEHGGKGYEMEAQGEYGAQGTGYDSGKQNADGRN